MENFKNSLGIYTLALALLCSPHVAGADVLSSPFNLELSAPSTLSLLNGVSQFRVPSGNLKTDIPNQTLSIPYAVAIQGIHLNLNYAFQTPTAITSLNEWSIQSTHISGEVIIDAINATQTIVQQSGGATIRIQVKAVCNDVHLKLKDGATSASAKLGVAFEGDHANYLLKDFSANWTPDAWEITSLTCTGPSGFGEVVRQDITEQLKTIDPFVPAIRTQIQDQLTAFSGKPIVWTMDAPGQSKITVTLKPSQLKVQADGSALIGGKAIFDFASLKNTNCQKTINEMPINPSTTDALVVPVRAVQGLVQCAYLSGLLTASFTSETFSAFQSLLGNFPLKLVVWPNLNRFNRHDLFNFNLSLDSAPDFEFDTSYDSGDFNFYLYSALTLSVYAPTDYGSAHYVDLSTTLDGPATFSVSDGILNFSQTTKHLKIYKYWDEDYLANHRVDQCIWTGIIGGYLKKFLSKTGVTYTLPTFQNAGAFSLGVDSATLNGNNATLKLNIHSLSPSVNTIAKKR